MGAFKSNRKLGIIVNASNENEASAFEDFWKPGGQTFPGNMPEGIMKDISTQRGEHT